MQSRNLYRVKIATAPPRETAGPIMRGSFGSGVLGGGPLSTWVAFTVDIARVPAFVWNASAVGLGLKRNKCPWIHFELIEGPIVVMVASMGKLGWVW